MRLSTARQFDLRYKGRIVSLWVAPRSTGWSWAALIDGSEGMESVDTEIPSMELAFANGLASVEEHIDSCPAPAGFPKSFAANAAVTRSA
jgi:hypothetical protein